MEGNASKEGADVGITQSSIHEMFAKVENAKQSDSSRHFTVLVSFLQIYNEKVYDLLNPNSVNLGKHSRPND